MTGDSKTPCSSKLKRNTNCPRRTHPAFHSTPSVPKSTISHGLHFYKLPPQYHALFDPHILSYHVTSFDSSPALPEGPQCHYVCLLPTRFLRPPSPIAHPKSSFHSPGPPPPVDGFPCPPSCNPPPDVVFRGSTFIFWSRQTFQGVLGVIGSCNS